MSNPNTVTVYSPQGEPFEMSRVNARDLCSHRGWSMSPLTVPPVSEAPAETKEAADAVNDSAGSVEDAETESSATETGEAEAGEEAEEEVNTAGVTIFTTEEEFASLPEREDVVDYLAVAFPDFKPHHKSSRDGLVAKAIELATGA